MEQIKMKILILGVSGMLGNTVFRYFSADARLDIYGSVRSSNALKHFSDDSVAKIKVGVDVENQDLLMKLFLDIKPDVVINCVGLIKQLSDSNSPLAALSINSMLPHRLALLCDLVNSRLIHISTDCVFSGLKGAYLESDLSDATDLYGRSKLLGEVYYPNSITLRTSIIGHELRTHNALIDWFLNQEERVGGFVKAIYSGLPTVELARVIKDFVIPNHSIYGLFHVAASPISKYDLLNLVSSVYGKSIEIYKDDSVVIDRSLNSNKFNTLTGYSAPSWPELINLMHASR